MQAPHQVSSHSIQRQINPNITPFPWAVLLQLGLVGKRTKPVSSWETMADPEPCFRVTADKGPLTSAFWSPVLLFRANPSCAWRPCEQSTGVSVRCWVHGCIPAPIQRVLGLNRVQELLWHPAAF